MRREKKQEYTNMNESPSITINSLWKRNNRCATTTNVERPKRLLNRKSTYSFLARNYISREVMMETCNSHRENVGWKKQNSYSCTHSLDEWNWDWNWHRVVNMHDTVCWNLGSQSNFDYGDNDFRQFCVAWEWRQRRRRKKNYSSINMNIVPKKCLFFREGFHLKSIAISDTLIKVDDKTENNNLKMNDRISVFKLRKEHYTANKRIQTFVSSLPINNRCAFGFKIY